MNNENKLWTQNDEEELWKMVNAPAESKLSTKEMAEKLGRTICAVYAKAYEIEKKKNIDITFSPKDQPDYELFKKDPKKFEEALYKRIINGN
jgi:hypothetical protein